MHELTRQQRIAFQIATLFTVLAALLYCSWPLGFWLNPAAQRTGLASELGAAHQPYDWFFIGADIVSGILLAAACMILANTLNARGWRKAGLIMLAAYGICGAIDAALPLKCLPSLQVCGSIWHDPVLIFHGIVDFSGSLALIGTLLAEGVYAYKYHKQWLPWVYAIGGGGIVFAALSLFFIIVHGPGYWAQRYYITLSCIWVASMPIIFYRQQYTTFKQMLASIEQL